MRFYTLLLACSLGVLLRAADIPVTDSTIVPGVRVGAIEKGMTLAGLKTLFGADKVKLSKIPGPEGSEMDGVVMFKGTDREIQIVFNPEGDKKEVWDVQVIGKGWTFSNGLKLDMTLEQIEKLNGKPFTMSGFDWDYGGWATFKGGKLEKGLSIRFYPTAEKVSPDLGGDRTLKSTDPKLIAAKPKISELSVDLSPGKK